MGKKDERLAAFEEAVREVDVLWLRWKLAEERARIAEDRVRELEENR